ncbi:hypothetical protein KIN20_028026 [Parelaphostrongylus tenuis]|uniref:Uncharacterized protein n=1 Tax=Parelaphostrongylus tenuis TaxID=148309 RepID=A0AAD5R058_PARTN|nr:hypothetical protein KIN20_028026 [Parelaphostrongylus tenuis]
MDVVHAAGFHKGTQLLFQLAVPHSKIFDMRKRMDLSEDLVGMLDSLLATKKHGETVIRGRCWLWIVTEAIKNKIVRKIEIIDECLSQAP